MNRVLASVIDRKAARRLSSPKPSRVRTIPRGLLLVRVSGGLDPSPGSGLSAPELIALARAARRPAINPSEQA
jgi:hypothetical protein